MHPFVRSGLMALGIVVALTLVVLGFAGRVDEQVKLPRGIERVVPSVGALVRPQEEIGVDLANDRTGVLVLDGAEIPEDQLTRVDPLGQVFFRPGTDKDLDRFEAGNHRVTVLFWPKAATRDSAETFSWRFQVG